MKLIDLMRDIMGLDDMFEAIDSLAYSYAGALRFGYTSDGVDYRGLTFEQVKEAVIACLYRVNFEIMERDSSLGGVYNFSERTIKSNKNNFMNSNIPAARLAENIAHEFTHAVQFEINPQAFDDYKDSNDGMEAYRDQLVERQARHFGSYNKIHFRKIAKHIVAQLSEKAA